LILISEFMIRLSITLSTVSNMVASF
jgi:hypothetical protein